MDKLESAFKEFVESETSNLTAKVVAIRQENEALKAEIAGMQLIADQTTRELQGVRQEEEAVNAEIAATRREYDENHRRMINSQAFVSGVQKLTAAYPANGI